MLNLFWSCHYLGRAPRDGGALSFLLLSFVFRPDIGLRAIQGLANALSHVPAWFVTNVPDSPQGIERNPGAED